MDEYFLKRIKISSQRELHVPIDLIVDIFSRLPVKYLMRLRTVCKLWYSLIYHPYFIEAHFKRSKKQRCYLMKANNKLLTARWPQKIYPICLYRENEDHENEELVEVFQPNEMGGGQFSITDSCNGLICFTDFYNLEPIGIYNPATREYTVLPKPYPYRTLDLALTYDPKTNDYKVFRLLPIGLSDPRVSQYEVFTLGSNQPWRRKGGVPYFANESRHIKADGATHWLFGMKRHVHSLLSIDTSTEEFKVHALPNPEHNNNNNNMVPFLIELNDNVGLCLINRFRMEISVLDRKNSSWTKKYTISLPNWISRSGQVRTWICPTSMRNSEILIARGRSKLVFFNVETQMSRRIDTSVVGHWADLVAMDHIESLVPCTIRWSSVRWPEIMEILDNIFPEYQQQGGRINLELKL